MTEDTIAARRCSRAAGHEAFQQVSGIFARVGASGWALGAGRTHCHMSGWRGRFRVGD